MKIFQIILEMTRAEALAVFRQYGADPEQVGLKAARNTVLRKVHPDLTGGDRGPAQQVNVAYEVLSGKTPETPQRSSSQPPPYRYNRPGASSGSARSGGYQGSSSRDGDDGGTPEWAWAGYSGGTEPNSRIYKSNFTDMNFIKKTMWEMSGKSKTPYTLWGFDGRYFRHTLTVFGSPKVFYLMATAMVDWQTKGGNSYKCRAVFINEGKSSDLYLIWADGTFYDKNPIRMEHESMNLNPSNDQQFMRRLPGILDELQAQHVHESIMERAIVVPSPRDPRLYAEVEEADDGIHVSFYRKSRGPGNSPIARLLSQGVIDDRPFHAVLDHVHGVLLKNSQM